MTTNSIGQVFQPIELASKIIAAFQTKNFLDYRKLMLASADLKEILNDYLKNNRIPKSEQEEFDNQKKIVEDSTDIRNQKEFNRL